MQSLWEEDAALAEEEEEDDDEFVVDEALAGLGSPSLADGTEGVGDEEEEEEGEEGEESGEEEGGGGRGCKRRRRRRLPLRQAKSRAWQNTRAMLRQQELARQQLDSECWPWCCIETCVVWCVDIP